MRETGRRCADGRRLSRSTFLRHLAENQSVRKSVPRAQSANQFAGTKILSSYFFVTTSSLLMAQFGVPCGIPIVMPFCMTISMLIAALFGVPCGMQIIMPFCVAILMPIVTLCGMPCSMPIFMTLGVQVSF